MTYRAGRAVASERPIVVRWLRKRRHLMHGHRAFVIDRSEALQTQKSATVI